MPSGSSSYVEVPGSPKDFAVLWDFEHYNNVVEMPLPVIRTGTQNMGNGVYWLKAGTPLSAEGAVANTSDAVYVVAEDFYFYENKPNQAKLVKVIVQGYVDLAEAEARSGLTYTEDALSALETAGVVMVDGKLAASGGGGGGLPPYTNDDLGKSLKLADSGETTTGTVTTIFEQTITTKGDKVPTSIQIAAYPWNVGDTIHLVIDGESQDCVVEPMLGGHKITASISGGLSMVIMDAGYVYGPTGETYTISATKEGLVPVAAPAWVSGGSSGGGVLVAHMTVEENVGTLDKTWQEITDADLAVIKFQIGDYQYRFLVTETVWEEPFGGHVTAISYNGEIFNVTFSAMQKSDYPSTTLGE